MKPAHPSVVVLAGPNGAGKSTLTPALLGEELGITEVVNADVIARGLSAFAPERAAISAGKIMIARLRELAHRRENFAFETTLASRTLAPWLGQLKQSGYRVQLIYIGLAHPDMAVARVAERVRAGGHDVPEETIRRRYMAGLRNFFTLYRELATRWRMYDNTDVGQLRPVAQGRGSRVLRIKDRVLWNAMVRKAQNEPPATSAD